MKKSSKGHSMIIEFIGLPGSGKSTIATYVEGELKKAQNVVRSRRHALADEHNTIARHLFRSRFVFFGILSAPLLLGKAAKIILHDGQGTSRETLKVMWNLWCVLGWYRWLWFTMRSEQITVVDQGLGQAIWSISLNAKKFGDDWQAFLVNVGIENIIFVHVRCDRELAAHRLSGRLAGNSRMGSISVVVDPLLWNRAELCMNILLKILDNIVPETSRFEIVNSGAVAPEEVAQSLLELLRKRHVHDYVQGLL